MSCRAVNTGNNRRSRADGRGRTISVAVGRGRTRSVAVGRGRTRSVAGVGQACATVAASAAPEWQGIEPARARESRRRRVLRQRVHANKGSGVGRACARTRIKAPEGVEAASARE